jgi:Glycosyl transferase 4-like domain
MQIPKDKRVLFVAYLFPPVGGAGVQRVSKFVKYLPSYGWQSSVLTVSNPSVPLRDESLAADVPSGTIIRRARTWEPNYAVKATVSGGRSAQGASVLARSGKTLARRCANFLLQPDPQALWRPQAVRTGRRLLSDVPHSVIVASGPPFSNFLVGTSLSRQMGLPLILDYRDEWGLSNAFFENKRPDPLSRMVQSRMQRTAVRQATAILGTTQATARALIEIRDRAGSNAAVRCITNGFDRDDFPESTLASSNRDAPFRLGYVGTLWNLMSAAPLVAAVSRLAEAKPEFVRNLELVFAGRRTPIEQQFLEKLKRFPCKVTEYPYLEHRAAIDLMGSSDGLCIFLKDTPGAERFVPAKTFEYMAVRKPIWAIAPPSELWDLLADYPSRHLLPPGDVDGIASRLEIEIQQHMEGNLPQMNGWDASQYERFRLAGELATVLDSVS